MAMQFYAYFKVERRTNKNISPVEKCEYLFTNNPFGAVGIACTVAIVTKIESFSANYLRG